MLRSSEHLQRALSVGVVGALMLAAVAFAARSCETAAVVSAAVARVERHLSALAWRDTR